jgi:hypothetical protein
MEPPNFRESTENARTYRTREDSIPLQAAQLSRCLTPLSPSVLSTRPGLGADRSVPLSAIVPDWVDSEPFRDLLTMLERVGRSACQGVRQGTMNTRVIVLRDGPCHWGRREWPEPAPLTSGLYLA